MAGGSDIRHDALMAEEIVVATSEADYARFGELVREYWGWLEARYAGQPGLMDAIGSEQNLTDELASLPAVYGPPAGRTLLALVDGELVGGVAYRDLHDGTCEMKRLFVREPAQGRGLGRRLARAVVDAATADGYTLLRLDTGFLNTEAMGMYERLGFEYTGPYHAYPPEILVHLRIMELSLTAPA